MRGGVTSCARRSSSSSGVSSGRYQQAEFAADLWQVHLGEGSDEYKNPQEFFRRTFLTESLKRLLVGGVQRIAGHCGNCRHDGGWRLNCARRQWLPRP
jgi:predicted AAA+ superfamily ATPase